MNEATLKAYEIVQVILVPLILVSATLGICLGYVITDVRAVGRQNANFIKVLLDLVGFSGAAILILTAVPAGIIYLLVYLTFVAQSDTLEIPVQYWAGAFVIGLLLMAWSIHTKSKKN